MAKSSRKTPRAKRTRLKDVAELANTSIATASRALNNSGYVSEETRLRILKIAELHNYQPNLNARGLKKRETHSIGLIVPNILNAYYTALADALNDLLADHGYHLLLSWTKDDDDAELEVINDMIGRAVDGLIWVPTSMKQQTTDKLLAHNIPVISIVRRIPDSRIDTVVFEDRLGSMAATNHLLRQGHKKIGYIGGDMMYSSNQDRWKGYCDASEEAGLEVDERIVRLGSNRSIWGMIATEQLIKIADPPTALYVASNAIMPGAIRMLRNANIRIPEEMSLICFDDVEWFAFSHPEITAVSIPHSRLAEISADIMVQKIAKPVEASRQPVFMEVSFELVVRNSTASPREGGLSLPPF